LTGSSRVIEECKRNLTKKIQHEGFRVDALFIRIGGVAKGWGDFPWARKIRYRCSKKVQNVRM